MAGRKSLAENWITPDGLLCIEGWAREGLKDKQIAKDKIGIGETTFCAWKNKYPEIVEALNKGKAPVDFKVENQALKSALGYTVTIKKPIKVRTKKQLKDKGLIEEEHIEYVEEEIYVPPVPALIIYWLKNRKPDKWKDRPVAPPKTDAVEDNFMKALEASGMDEWEDDEDEDTTV